jgi:perosamine synthetase
VKVPIARASLTPQEISSVLEPLNSGWLVQGPKVQEFESKWTEFSQAPHSIAVTSCTSALHLSLAALGIGAGDEVIVPAFTWISTANVVEHLGATVVFADIDLETFNIDVNDLQRRLTSKTKAIMPVHLFGLAANMSPIMEFASDNRLFVVEDAACGFGTTYRGKHVGTFGDAGCFSFHPRKAITTGEGGMIVTKNENLAVRLRQLRDHGAEVSDLQRHSGARPYLLAEFPDAGYNQRMTDIQGALGSAQMDRASEILTERRRLANRYDEAFRDLRWLRSPHKNDYSEHSYQSYPCLFLPEECSIALESKDSDLVVDINKKRNSWMDSLQIAGVSTRPATHAVHMLEYYREKYSVKPEDYFSSFIADQCSISLPLFHGMTEVEQNYVINQVLSASF